MAVLQQFSNPLERDSRRSSECSDRNSALIESDGIAHQVWPDEPTDSDPCTRTLVVMLALLMLPLVIRAWFIDDTCTAALERQLLVADTAYATAANNAAIDCANSLADQKAQCESNLTATSAACSARLSAAATECTSNLTLAAAVATSDL